MGVVWVWYHLCTTAETTTTTSFNYMHMFISINSTIYLELI